jgi:hypothetical protein
MDIPESYILQKLYSCAVEPSYRKDNSCYNAGCPICKEGTSSGKKKRLFFYTKTKTFYCFNCNKSWSATNWIIEACKISYRDIINEIKTNTSRVDITDRILTQRKDKTNHTLPFDSINLCDNVQLSNYKNNSNITRALDTIRERRLDTAINKPKAYYISLTDFTHRNRLCIPFYNREGDIVYYQTRSLDNTLPKYLSKTGDKEVYGVNNIKDDCEYIFIFEGPIDAMFVQNGVGVTGLNLTHKQQKTLSQFPFFKKIWITDNQNLDAAAKEKTDNLLKAKLPVFVWPTNINVKDFNALSCLLKQDSISHEFILKYTVNL